MDQTATATLAKSVPSLLGNKVQWGYVVRDIEAAMRQWTELFRVGPFIYITNPGKVEAYYRGKPSDVKVHTAFTYLGDTQVELIEQYNDAPSPYRDFLAAGREGLQHFGFWVDDFEGTRRQLESATGQPIYSVRLAGAAQPSLYYEVPTTGLVTELCESTPQKTALYGAMAALAHNWDGTKPVRRYEKMADFAVEQGVPSWSNEK